MDSFSTLNSHNIECLHHLYFLIIDKYSIIDYVSSNTWKSCFLLSLLNYFINSLGLLGVAKVVLKKGKTQLFKDGNPMVYSGAVDRIIGRPPPKTGDIVLVSDGTEKPIGWGLYNSVSMFCVRLMQLEDEATRYLYMIICSQLFCFCLARWRGLWCLVFYDTVIQNVHWTWRNCSKQELTLLLNCVEGWVFLPSIRMHIV